MQKRGLVYIKRLVFKGKEGTYIPSNKPRCNLRPQKTKKTKIRSFRPQEAREFLGDKNSNTVKTEIPQLGRLPSRGQEFLDEKWTIIRIFGTYVLRIPKDPAILKTLQVVNHYRDSNSLLR